MQIVAQLDEWMLSESLRARAEGLPGLSACTIKLLGQMALLERAAPLHLVATHDVDVRANYEHAVEQEFARLLQAAGMELDRFGREIWMPRETSYDLVFRGSLVSLRVADMDAVLVSKAFKAPQKNKALLTEYLASGPTERFLLLAERYQLALEPFL